MADFFSAAPSGGRVRPPRGSSSPRRHPLRHAARQSARAEQHPFRRRRWLSTLPRLSSPGRASEFHCYHPQPYYDPRDSQAGSSHPISCRWCKALAPGGQFFIQTDNPGYWRYIRAIVPFFFDFHERIGKWPDAPKGRTRREIIALKRGLPIFRGSGTAKAGLSEHEALILAEELPPPVFDADRRLHQLDEEEGRTIREAE